MELQSVSQVAKTFGISTRMLRYYEQVGLIQSIRNEDNSYRYYDETALKRVQQITILRKLQIPVKQIAVILDNPDVVTATEIFNENISTIQAEITALETIKTALKLFVAKIEKLAAVRLDMNLLTDETVMELAHSLSLTQIQTQKNVKENTAMDELNKAAETLNKSKLNQVRVVYTPTETIAMLGNVNEPPSKQSKELMAKFIKDVDLFKIKPDFRCGFNYGFFVTIPDDLDVPEPFKKQTFDGGLWAVYKITPDNFDEFDMVSDWVKDRDDYLRDYQRPRHDVYFNPLNVYGMKNTDLFDSFHDKYKEAYEPIMEVENHTNAEQHRLNALLKKTEDLIAQRTPTDIDLSNIKRAGELDPIYNNGILEIVSDGNMNGLKTPKEFALPMKIDLRIKTNNPDIVIKYAHGTVQLTDMGNSFGMNNSVLFWPFEGGEWRVHENCSSFPRNEFVDIEYIFGKDICAIKINGEVRYLRDDDGYIKLFADNPDFSISSTIDVCSWGGYVGVEHLRVTEI